MTALVLPLVVLALSLMTAWAAAAVGFPLWAAAVKRRADLARWTPMICTLPMISGLVVAVAAVLPGDPHIGQLLGCHCAVSMPTWLHLCLQHPEKAITTAPAAALAVGLLLPGRLLALLRLARLPLGRGGADPVITDLPTPTAMLFGWLWPTMVIDQKLWMVLTEPERAAVIAHEHGHLARQDPLLLMALRMLISVGPRDPGLAMLRGWLAHAETRADAAAVREVGDPLVVAQALLQCAREASSRPSLSLSWTGGGIEQRIESLLTAVDRPAQPRPDVGWTDVLVVAGLMLVGLAVSPWLHHQVEHLMNLSL